MYAVVHTGGKQYKLQTGDVCRFEKIPGDIGTSVSFDRVLLFSDGQNLQIGQPVLDNVLVQGHIVEQDRAQKIIVFKYKRRKRYRRKQGHRQYYTAVKIDRIGVKGQEPEPMEIQEQAVQQSVDTPEVSAAATPSQAES